MSVLEGQLGAAFRRGLKGAADWDVMVERDLEIARRMAAQLADKHRDVLLDPSPYISLIGTRRAGKTFLMAVMALVTGLTKPGSIVIIGSLTLKALKRNFWHGAPSGLPRLARMFGIKVEFNGQDLRWELENGSIGFLLGAENREYLEYWRGMEADLYLLDECKSFAPGVLRELIDDIISPQRISRNGRVVMGGTPGAILKGPFYECTMPGALDEKKRPFSVPYGETDPSGRRLGQYWSRHKILMQDNDRMPHQWAAALDSKEMKGWADDHPTWRREYLGEWVGSEGLVYAYLNCKSEKEPGHVNWVPKRLATNPTGLPEEMGPWHLVFGLDIGFEDPTAIVVAAWSENAAEVRHVWDDQYQHLTPPEVLGLVAATAEKFGTPEAVVYDPGGGGRMLAEWFEERGIPVVRAEKADKFDHIDLINGEFHTGRIKIIEGSKLEDQLCSVQWDLEEDTKEVLAHKGRLREDSKIPNDLTDAFLYLLRYCYHGFASEHMNAPERGTPEWVQAKEKEAFQRAAMQVRTDLDNTRLYRPWTIPTANRWTPPN